MDPNTMQTISCLVPREASERLSDLLPHGSKGKAISALLEDLATALEKDYEKVIGLIHSHEHRLGCLELTYILYGKALKDGNNS